MKPNTLLLSMLTLTCSVAANQLQVLLGHSQGYAPGYGWMRGLHGMSNISGKNNSIHGEFASPRSLIATSPFTAITLAGLATGAAVYHKVGPVPSTKTEKIGISATLGALFLYFLKPVTGGLMQGCVNILFGRSFNQPGYTYNPWNSW